MYKKIKKVCGKIIAVFALQVPIADLITNWLIEKNHLFR